MTGRVSHVALVMSLNKRFDRKVIEGVTRFVRESDGWSVFLDSSRINKAAAGAGTRIGARTVGVGRRAAGEGC